MSESKTKTKNKNTSKINGVISKRPWPHIEGVLTGQFDSAIWASGDDDDNNQFNLL